MGCLPADRRAMLGALRAGRSLGVMPEARAPRRAAPARPQPTPAGAQRPRPADCLLERPAHLARSAAGPNARPVGTLVCRQKLTPETSVRGLEASWPARQALPPNDQARRRQGIAGIFTATRHRECIFGRHKGYARLALQAGCPVVPVYHLGNSQVRAGPGSKPGRVRRGCSRMSIRSSACADARSVRKQIARAPAAVTPWAWRRIGLVWPSFKGASKPVAPSWQLRAPSAGGAGAVIPAAVAVAVAQDPHGLRPVLRALRAAAAAPDPDRLRRGRAHPRCAPRLPLRGMAARPWVPVRGRRPGGIWRCCREEPAQPQLACPAHALREQDPGWASAAALG